MKNLWTLFVVVILAALTSYFVAQNSKSGEQVSAVQKTAFDRVTENRVLRCGYAIATPWTMIDANTKKISGVNYDMTMAVAQKIGLTVEWVEETGWGVAEQGLIAGRYDMLCGNVCIDPRRAQAATFSTPFMHIPFVAVVRSDDQRFATGSSSINDAAIRIGVKNGHVFEYMANEQFPLAQKVYANDITDDAEFFEMLKTNKIDVAFAGQETVDLYNQKNNNAIRSLPQPVRFCNGAFMLPLGDERLKHLIDNAITELNSSGIIEQILGRFTKLDPNYIRVPAVQYR